MKSFIFLTGVLATSVILLGCQKFGGRGATVAKRPRPVETKLLELSSPPKSATVSATVASWKTEEIGFEIPGRIQSVVEPNTAIAEHVIEVIDSTSGDPGDNGEPSLNGDFESGRRVLFQGTPIAQLETESYELQVKIAEANLDRAKQAEKAAMIELTERLESERLVVEAERELSVADFNRIKQLWERNAVPRSEYDRAIANQKTADAKVKQLEASVRTKESETVSLRLEIQRARQTLRDAQRNLKNCTLYSLFRGQVADVSVVPGSVVSAGTPVATIQMMNPIKVEIEVSAEKSRELRSRQLIPIWLSRRVSSDVSDPSAPVTTELQPENGFLYLIDPVADSQTRTFTVTLLVLNRRTTIETPENENVATTDHAWRLNLPFLPGTDEGKLFIPTMAIQQDQTGHFLWRINNMKINQTAPEDSLLKVQRLPIALKNSKLPFLGNWMFQEIEVLDPTFDPLVDLVAGRLLVASGQPDDWRGDTILVDRGNQWMLRPGDTVQVDLSPTQKFAKPGYYVPMDALSREALKTFLYVVDEPAKTSPPDAPLVRRIEVELVDGYESATSSLRRIRPTNGELSQFEGLRYVTKGAHYLRDKEPVRLIDAAGARQ